MNVLLFGGTGMVGQGVLRECLLDPRVQLVETVGRTATGVQHPKLREVVHADLWNYEAIAGQLTGLNACFFCLGVSSRGMTEEDYARVTYGITLAAAEILCRLNPRMAFFYISGRGTDSTEQGRFMWARVKGKTENALLRLPCGGAYMLRPGVIQPLHGARSKTALYRFLYSMSKPLLPLMRAMFPDEILTTVQIGQAMLAIAEKGFPKKVLENKDIRVAAENHWVTS